MSQQRSLQVNIQQDISIAELSEAHRSGTSVMRSAHIGNLSPYNLALVGAGIPTLLVDNNVGGADTTYFPERTIARDGESNIGLLGVVSTRALVQSTGEDVYVDEYHVEAIEKAIPQADVFTNTEYLRRNAGITEKVVRIAASETPQLFKRIVRSDGTSHRLPEGSPIAAMMTLDGKTLQLGDDPRAEVEAALIPVEVDIVASMVVEAISTGSDSQFHIAGPSMASYLREGTKQRESVDRLYDLVKSVDPALNSKLPDVLTFNLVNATDARFAGVAEDAEKLDDVIASYDQMVADLGQCATERATFFCAPNGQNTPDEIKRYVSGVKTRELDARRSIVAPVLGVPDLLVDANDSGVDSFTTQYDVIALGGLYVAQANMERPISELSIMTREMRRQVDKYGK